MQEDPTITNILSIAGAGLLILLTGIGFIVFRDFFYKYIRFFLPIPPISVAAYIYVYNFFQHNNGELPGNLSEVFKDVLLGIGIGSFSFATFVVLLIWIINTFRKMLI